ncbi:SMP-30/gluconolactonase/LRE family protein [Streptomyces sp. NPDC047981]|uniref:SMP-30/gluconolactonase/LRE family protein n=1 Tax=Streptomyces sp. NPDC047981 TaxID=3154610 RepID=UPI00341A3A2E
MTAEEIAPTWRAYTSTRHRLAEGARWMSGSLLFVDLLRGDLYRVRGVGGGSPELLLRLNMPLGAVAPTSGASSGRWIVAAGMGIALADARGGLDWLARPADRPDRAMRMNDGGCDRAGRFWAGSMEVGAALGAGSLYRVDPDGTVHEVLDGLTVPNGPVFTADGCLMYIADSARGIITRHPVDPASGALGEPARFASFPPEAGRPDGMAVDDDQNLWVALWGTGRILCLAPDGRRLRTVHLPTPHTSSVAFGGGLMFATTATHRLDRPGPLDGAVLAAGTGVTAPPVRPFRLIADG